MIGPRVRRVGLVFRGAMHALCRSAGRGLSLHFGTLGALLRHALRRAFKTVASTLTVVRRWSRSIVDSCSPRGAVAPLACPASSLRPGPTEAIQIRIAARVITWPAARSWFPVLRRPQGGMSEAQRVDLAAAQAGKITWGQYFAMWGPS